MKTKPEHLMPRARTERMLFSEVADELLIYELDRNKAHCLNSTAALVWKQCDGKTGIAEITRMLNIACGAAKEDGEALREDIVRIALKQLERAELIEKMEIGQTSSPRFSRRELIKKAGIAAAVALPAISSIVAPTAVEAATGCLGTGAPCTANSQCCSMNCAGLPGPAVCA